MSSRDKSQLSRAAADGLVRHSTAVLVELRELSKGIKETGREWVGLDCGQISEIADTLEREIERGNKWRDEYNRLCKDKEADGGFE